MLMIFKSDHLLMYHLYYLYASKVEKKVIVTFATQVMKSPTSICLSVDEQDSMKNFELFM